MTRIGVIFLGNTGAGKSFLANQCFATEKFEHKCKPTAVTTTTECEEVSYNGSTYLIFNIPGLIENNQTQIDRNKREIDKAFDLCPNSIVIFIFGTQNGRIRNEDVIAFNALNDAYPFDSNSLLIVGNSIPNDRDEYYEGETILLLQKLLQMEDACKHMCFLETINKENQQEIQKLRENLFQRIDDIKPKAHIKEHDIQLNSNDIKVLIDQISQMQREFHSQKEELLQKIRETQQKYNEEMIKLNERFQSQLKTHENTIGSLQKDLAAERDKCNIL